MLRQLLRSWSPPGAPRRARWVPQAASAYQAFASCSLDLYGAELQASPGHSFLRFNPPSQPHSVLHPHHHHHRPALPCLPCLPCAFHLQALFRLQKLKESSWFWAPVRPEDAPDYTELVQRPMDLATASDRLKLPGGSHGAYASAAEFLADVRLVWDNCLQVRRALWFRWLGQLFAGGVVWGGTTI